MRLLATRWNNFRNLKPRRLKWGAGLNLLTGVNGSGKTNMLEALNIICGWGAFGGAKTPTLLAWGGRVGGASLVAEAEGDGREPFIIDIGITSRVSVKIENDRKTRAELRSVLPAICFLPQDMNLIGGAPAVRRAFIDRLCALLSPSYAHHLSDYRRLIRHRVKLLKKNISAEITSPLLASIGSWVWKMRNAAVRLLTERLSTTSELLPLPMKLSLKRGGAGEERGPIEKEDFLELLAINAERERRACVPFVGPQADDMLASCETTDESEAYVTRSAADALSRGQRRRAAVALMLAAGRVIEERLRLSPIFMIDEIASELDVKARAIMASSLADTGWQVFAASAENTFADWRGEVYTVSGGDRDTGE